MNCSGWTAVDYLGRILREWQVIKIKKKPIETLSRNIDH